METVEGGSGGGSNRLRPSSLGRRLSRRLSLISKMPTLLAEKTRGGSRDSSAGSSSRRLEITVIAPDKTQRILYAEHDESVGDVLRLLLAEYSVQVPRLSLAGSRAEVDASARASLLDGEILIVDEGLRKLRAQGDENTLYRATEHFLLDEVDYIVSLRSIGELYANPIRRLGYLEPDEYQEIFDAITGLVHVCQTLTEQLEKVLDDWEIETIKIGQLFPDNLWNQYEDYQDVYRKARQLLREKTEDDDFVELCKLRKGAAKHSLQSLLDLPVQRLAQYEQYLQTYITDSSLQQQSNEERENAAKAKAKAKQAVKRGQEESDLERIQDIFPNDDLHLYDKDVLTMRMKGLMRKRSGTAARLTRALSAKSLRPESPPPATAVAPQQSQSRRQFVMEAPVQLTAGVQSQDRHLFLFDDLLLVAKARSGGNFKLKDKVRVSELWLTASPAALDDVAELHRSPDTSFVIGWPTTNVVATFTTCKQPHENEVKKSAKKAGRIRIGQVFRRSLSKDNSGCLFGQPLARVCEGETLPRPVMMMLQQVLAKGPFTQGIFRKSANARLVRELREKLDSGDEAVAWEHIPVLVTAALLKDFLRSLPDPLLTSALYPHWKAALDAPNPNTKLIMLKQVLQQLPKANHSLLAYFVCVLHHISRRSAQNLMSAANLGVCVGPSLLWGGGGCPGGSGGGVVVEDLRAVPALVEALITNCQFLLGSHVPHLLGDPRDSGTEESDSLRRDDSSIDSLECSPPPRKDKMSLSRDSGLTMSDSQLYTPDEEESGSTSSSGYDPAFDPHTKVTPSLSVPGEYVRVYGGWEERLNPNFSRQAWFRQRSRRLSSAPNANQKGQEDAVRRSASEESLLDSAPPPTPPRRNRPDNSALKCELLSPIRQANDKNEFPEDKFGRHPPLRKVTAVHCEVVDVSYKENPLHLYSVNCARNNEADSSYAKNNFVSPRIPAEQMYSSQAACEQKYSRSRGVDAQYSTPISGHVQRLSESYSSPRLHDSSPSHDSPKMPRPSEYYYSTPEAEEMENGGGECEDSSTLSDDDCTPHVSRSNSRGNEVTPKLRHLPPVHVADAATAAPSRGRLRRKEERAAHAHRSRSLPPPPPYRPPPPANTASNRRAPITSYYLGDCSQSQRYVVTRSFLDEESYV
ncbi:uncharacterized protein LOC111049360 [Nilaparvata lugens]|uniref:uncharacterized protein LOC111049360 n=1 Tax=Nilaparvata lugens TaxID=108931 RepID=UPI00193D3B54|nr:uncharacterized protein LOC111049360 [Nilaparvata lugens]